ncbi:N-acetylmuramic acid 6-phosphate etherase [Macrococcoides goetzii]|uniref:N-acetylmuramic acid 6-phosphate etherase n=1 Tax=Macrococcoides goetzii TaxID=1891097 RepID=A0A395G9F3_9STAP|nr:N-acetylmuramic acid 6-phosphate etherase [Macrococcus goetzii]
MSYVDLNRLATEQRNVNTMALDRLSPIEFVTVMNQEDQKVAIAIEKEKEKIADLIAESIPLFKNGGRLIYMGAGTSGRLGVLDAAECVPTFGTTPEQVIGLIAGGEKAMIKAVEGAEDDEQLGKDDLIHLNITDKDIVIGIAASGRTPYVVGGLKFANEVGALTGAISCNTGSDIGKIARHGIDVAVGPEILTGSTRLKSGTAQKLILNMISTGIMVGIGKVYQNLMIDVQPTNEKLVERSIGIISEVTALDRVKAKALFEESEHQVKVAIVMGLHNFDKDSALEYLKNNDGFIRAN